MGCSRRQAARGFPIFTDDDPKPHALVVGVEEISFGRVATLGLSLPIDLPQIANKRRVVIFAGQRYREFLIEPFEQRGLKVEVPMEHPAQGE